MTLETLFARAAQGQAFLLAAAAGTAAGALVQAGGALRRVRRWLGAAADLLAALLLGAGVWGASFLGGGGLRGYSLLGLLLGLAAWGAGMAPAAAALARGVKKFCRPGRNAGRG